MRACFAEPFVTARRPSRIRRPRILRHTRRESVLSKGRRMPGSEADRREKQHRIGAVRAASGADALLLTSHEAVTWYLEGIRSHVSLAGPPVAAVRVGADGDTLFVADNEADRLVAE